MTDEQTCYCSGTGCQRPRPKSEFTNGRKTCYRHHTPEAKERARLAKQAYRAKHPEKAKPKLTKEQKILHTEAQKRYIDKQKGLASIY